MIIRIGSLNLNKGISNKRRQGDLIRWLEHQRIHLLLTQEPAGTANSLPERFASYICIGGNDKVCAWQVEGSETSLTATIGPFWQHINPRGIRLWNVYLDASSTRARAAQLTELSRLMEPQSFEPIIVVGDFNIAPTAEDGLYGGRPSGFNTKTDRAPLAALMEQMQLVDVRSAPDRQEFTVQRPQLGKLVQFRCDLALVSQRIMPQVCMTYDHVVRDVDDGFTDHSALILDIDVPALHVEVQR